MSRILLKLALGLSLALLAIPSDVFAGRGGGRGGGGGGGGGYGGGSRGGYGGQGGGSRGNPSFSQPRQPSSQSRPQGGSGYQDRSSTGNRPQYGNSGGGAYRNQGQSPSNAGAAAAGAGYANKNQNRSPSNAGAAAAGAGAENRNQGQTPSNAGAAAAGAGYANRNQQPNASNAGAAAAGAGYANRNQQPNLSNAGAAAAGAGYANRNQQPNLSNAGAAAAGAGYANRNQQPNLSNAGAAAAGASYANRNQPGMVNGYWNGNNSAAAWGATAVGLGAAAGVAAWGVGSPMYSYGYSSYSNPYAGPSNGQVVDSQPSAVTQVAAAGADYSQPISTTFAPPAPPVADQSSSAFDQARQAFLSGDYDNALQFVQQALASTPNDTTQREFLALVYFAKGNFDQAAAPLYAVLSVGPGWDWTTLSGMYPDVETYTRQLRTLEAFSKANPNSAHAYFVLAYHYLCQGHDENAIAQLKKVVALQPSDTLSAQIIAQSQPPVASAPTPAAASPAVDGKLTGNWTVKQAKDAGITLAIQDDGQFKWVTSAPGKPPMTIAGTSTFADGVLSLSDQGGQNGVLAGQVVWQDADHFNFRLANAPQADTGLNFSR
ncbi:hypothetical protein EP7_004765 [Isosphaeraceae bacterium EP7]